MPTYRNDGKTAYKILNSNNAMQIVLPGEAVQTYRILTLTDFTKTAEAPYFNPSDGVHGITSTGPGDDKTINLNSNTAEIELWNESTADITCFLRATANTPGFKILASSIRTISGLKGQVDKVVLQFSGAVSAGDCYLTELEG